MPYTVLRNVLSSALEGTKVSDDLQKEDHDGTNVYSQEVVARHILLRFNSLEHVFLGLNLDVITI